MLQLLSSFLYGATLDLFDSYVVLTSSYMLNCSLLSCALTHTTSTSRSSGRSKGHLLRKSSSPSSSLNPPISDASSLVSFRVSSLRKLVPRKFFPLVMHRTLTGRGKCWIISDMYIFVSSRCVVKPDSLSKGTFSFSPLVDRNFMGFWPPIFSFCFIPFLSVTGKSTVPGRITWPWLSKVTDRHATTSGMTGALARSAAVL